MFAYGNDVSDKLREVLFEFSKKTSGTQFPTPRLDLISETWLNL